MANMIFDDKEFMSRTRQLVDRVEHQKMVALGMIAGELLRLSQLEVPFKTGHLMQSGSAQPQEDEFIVGYNTPYAARMHEHPEYHFKNGRKGKYLEQPMKMNLLIFRKLFDEQMGQVYA